MALEKLPIKSLDGFTGRVLIFTSNGILLCSRLANGNIAGINAQSVSVSIDGLAKDGANVKTVKINVQYGSDSALLKSIEVVKYDFDAEELAGLQNIVLRRTGDFAYQVVTDCGNINLFDDYQSELAATALWKVVNMNNGTEVVVSSVVAGSATKQFVLTLASVPVALAAPSILSAAGIADFDQYNPLIDNGA